MHIFISHATANAGLATVLAEAFERLGATTFLASRAGDIRADEDWLRGIERALEGADAYVVLLTPESVLRPWVNFEAGAAWFSKKQLLFLRIQALPAGDIPLPVSARQVYALDDVGQFGAILDAVHLPRNAIQDIVGRLARVAAEAVPAGENEPAWEAIQVEGVYYAWAGPLLRLQDNGAIPPPATLLRELERRGLQVRWGNQDRLAHHVQRGLAQVFATDRERWRRPVVDRGRLLLVGQQ
jgi:hypothetical protein